MGKPVSAILNRQYSKLGFAAVLLLSLMAAACGKGDVHASPPPKLNDWPEHPVFPTNGGHGAFVLGAVLEEPGCAFERLPAD